jgi:hypothetical protein
MARSQHWELERLGLLPEPFPDLDRAMERAEILLQVGFGPVRLVEVRPHKGGQQRSVVRVYKSSQRGA